MALSLLQRAEGLLSTYQGFRFCKTREMNAAVQNPVKPFFKMEKL